MTLQSVWEVVVFSERQARAVKVSWNLPPSTSSLVGFVVRVVYPFASHPPCSFLAVVAVMLLPYDYPACCWYAMESAQSLEYSKRSPHVEIFRHRQQTLGYHHPLDLIIEINKRADPKIE